MFKSNPHFAKLPKQYLFKKIAEEKAAFLKQNPEARLIDLGIGDTVLPLPEVITKALQKGVADLETEHGYTGYEPYGGRAPLRSLISEKVYQGRISLEEITISDGAKCDIGRLALLFGSNMRIGVQDPTYPVYVDVSILSGLGNITLLPCNPENGFFPDLTKSPALDILYLCYPNNPTGSVATRAQLKSAIDYAKEHQCLIIYDAAYSCFIQNSDFPKSIYEIKGANEVAIEIGSFSKSIGFTGLRLGWTVIPKTLKYQNGALVHENWSRILSTYYNGPSNLAQIGGIAALSDAGLSEGESRIKYYLENARILKGTIETLGYTCFGGDHAPYIWVDLKGENSWEAFHKLLEKAHLITTPGSGFGPSGEGFLRLSAFGKRENIEEAAARLQKSFIINALN